MIKERKVGHKALRIKNGELETFDPHPSPEQEKWEEEARKEANILYTAKPIKIAYLQGYLRACKMMQGEIDELKGKVVLLEREAK